MPNKTQQPDGSLAWSRVLIIVGFVILLAALAGVFALGQRFVSSRDWVQHTIQVRQLGQEAGAALNQAEADQRNYLISHDASFATSSTASQQHVKATLARLRKLTIDNPVQTARIDGIAPLLDQRFDLLNRGSALVDAKKYDEAITLATTGPGKSLMQRITDELQALDSEEARLFDARQERAASELSLLTLFVGITIAFSFALGVIALLTTSRYLAALRARNEALVRESAMREEVEAQLRQSQKMDAIGRLAGGIAHDFNNMLAVIVGNIEMIIRRIDLGPERLRPLAANALDGAKRAGVLTQRLLAFSRQMPLSPKAMDPNRAVSGIMEMLNRALGERVSAETVLGAGTWRIHVDEPQLESALLNLAVNARDAMPEGGKLTIETSNSFLDERYAAGHPEVVPGQYVLISITDNGHGMTPEIAAKAFEPFFTTKDVGAGTGLGLSQVHGFIKQSGGHIKLYSELNVGTTVKLYLPRYTGPEEVRPTERTVSAREPIGCKVLLVEDEESVRTFVAEALAELGCKVVEAHDATSALEELKSHDDVTVMLTDVVMPGRSGRVLADLAREQRPDLRVLYMTGYTRNAIVHNGVLDTGTHLLTKPFTLAELEQQLKSVLDQKSGTKISAET